jgi:hypothetical protein
MLFKNKKHKANTAITVLASLTWMVCGGNVWAEARSAERDPSAALMRLAQNPRLALAPEEKKALQMAANAMAPETRTEQVRIPASHAGTDPAAEMSEIATELDSFNPEEKKADAPPAASRLRQRLEAAHRKALREFEATEALVRKADLPKVIVERHQDARAKYMEKIQAVFRSLDAAGKSQDPKEARSAMAAASELLRKSTDERPVQEFDPSRLPFRMAKPVERQPFVPKKRPGAQGKAATAVITEKLVAPTANDLAANEDVQITPAIQQLAASLGNQPLAIYNWVRNNIEFLPTQGSVQGAQMTLDAKRGNAYDISSLLMALLRSAGVHAKYATGTVEVPVSSVMNWVGGAETPQVAQQLLGQGGIPNVGLTSGGTITHIRIEHVWVEAFIDYIPSRGALHRVGDTWVPMDAAFKLHTFTPRSDLFTDNPISAVVDPTDALFTVDESLGKVSGVDDQALQDRLTDWVSQSDQYILANYGLHTNPEDLLRRKLIVQETKTTFPGSLPYQVLTRAAGVSTLPANLRHYVTLNGFNSAFDRALGDPSFSVKLSLPELNSRRLSIQFDPATQADADTLQAARDNGSSSLPVYLVNVVPVIKVDGVERGRGSSIRMGSFYSVDVVLQSPEGPTTIPYQVVAGDEIVVGVTGNGINKNILEKRFAGNPVDNAPEYFHQVQMHYWMECDYLGEAAAQAHGVHMLRLPSVGFFSSPLTVSYLFGSPRSGVYKSRIMDVKQSLLGAAGQDPAKVLEYMKQSGMQGSYLEGSVFDQLHPGPGIRGISSIHLIRAAMAQEVPIYRITSANSSAVMPLLQLSSQVESDIATAVNQGKTVLAPERNVDIGLWSGVGYIIQDETTGGGAYLISGGLSGGGWLECLPDLVPIFELILALLLFLAIIALIIGAIVSAPVGAPAYAMVALLLLLFGGMSGMGNPGTGPVA